MEAPPYVPNGLKTRFIQFDNEESNNAGRRFEVFEYRFIYLLYKWLDLSLIVGSLLMFFPGVRRTDGCCQLPKTTTAAGSRVDRKTSKAKKTQPTLPPVHLAPSKFSSALWLLGPYLPLFCGVGRSGRLGSSCVRPGRAVQVAMGHGIAGRRLGLRGGNPNSSAPGVARPWCVGCLVGGRPASWSFFAFVLLSFVSLVFFS